MKLSEVFSRKKQGAQSDATVEVNPFSSTLTDAKFFHNDKRTPNETELASPEACNCADVLGVPTEGGRQAFHHNVTQKLLDLIGEPDDAQRLTNVTEKISKLRRTEPLDDPKTEFTNHLAMHIYNSGHTPEEIMGIPSGSLGAKFKTTQGIAQQAQAAAAVPPTYDNEDCGVCKQYLSSIKAHISKHKNETENIAMMTTGTKPEDLGKSSEEILYDTIENHVNGNFEKARGSESLAMAHDAIGNWNKHSSSEHGESLFDFGKGKVPVRNDEASKGFIRNFYKSVVQNLPSGWGLKKNETPPNPYVYEKGNKKRNDLTEDRLEELLRSEGNGEAEINRIAEEAKKRGESSGLIFKRPVPDRFKGGWDIQEPTPRQELEAPRGMTVQDFGGDASKRYYGDEPPSTSTSLRSIAEPEAPTVFRAPGADFVGYPSRPKLDALYKPYNSGGYYMRERSPRAEQIRTPGEDVRSKLYDDPVNTGSAPEIKDPELRSGFNSTLPRHGRFLFDQTGIKPDTAGLEEHARATYAYENQPSHTVIDTGKTETIEEPQFETKTFIKRDTGLVPYGETYTKESDENWKTLEATEEDPKVFTEKRRNWQSEWRKKNDSAVVERRTPKLDKSGKPVTKAIVRPITETHLIPEEQRLQMPSEESHAAAQEAYNKSLDSALQIAYPWATGRDAQLDALKRDHALHVNKLEEERIRSLDPKNRKIQASKETIMFNSNNKKEATFDPSVIPAVAEHVVRGLVHQFNDARQNVDQGAKGTATVKLLAEGIGSGLVGRHLLNKYKDWANNTDSRSDEERANHESWKSIQDSGALEDKSHLAAKNDDPLSGAPDPITEVGRAVTKTIQFGKDVLKNRDVIKQEVTDNAKQLGLMGLSVAQDKVRDLKTKLNDRKKIKQHVNDQYDMMKSMKQIRDAKAQIEMLASNKKVCEKCGKKCTDETECKKNRDDRRREQSASSAYDD